MALLTGGVSTTPQEQAGNSPAGKQDKPLFELRTSGFVLQTSVIQPEGIRYSKGAVYNEEIIINRSSPVLFYSHSTSTRFDVNLMFVAMENARTEVEDVLTALWGLVHAETQAGIDPPSLCYVTLGDNDVFQQKECEVVNVAPNWGVNQMFDNGMSMMALCTLSFISSDLENKSRKDYKGATNFKQLSFPGSGS